MRVSFFSVLWPITSLLFFIAGYVTVPEGRRTIKEHYFLSTMNHLRLTRVKKELDMLLVSPPHGISCYPVDGNITKFEASAFTFLFSEATCAEVSTRTALLLHLQNFAGVRDAECLSQHEKTRIRMRLNVEP